MFSNLCNDVRLGVLRCLVSKVTVTCVTGQTGAGVKCGSALTRASNRFSGQNITRAPNRFTGHSLTRAANGFVHQLLHTTTRRTGPPRDPPVRGKVKKSRKGLLFGSSFLTTYTGYFWYENSEMTTLTERNRCLFHQDHIVSLSQEACDRNIEAWKQHNGKNRVLPPESEQMIKAQKLIDRLVKASPDIVRHNTFTAHVIDNEGLDVEAAEAMAHGGITICKSLVDKYSDNELAVILAREMSHTILKHQAEGFSRLVFWQLLLLYTFNCQFTEEEMKPWLHRYIRNYKSLTSNYKHSEIQLEADSMGAFLTARACINPHVTEDIYQQLILHPLKPGLQKTSGADLPPDTLAVRLTGLKLAVDRRVKRWLDRVPRYQRQPSISQRWNNIRSRKALLLAVYRRNCVMIPRPQIHGRN